MTRPKLIFLAAGASLLLAVPAQAQHQGHTMPMPAKKPAAKKPAAKKPAAKKPSAKKPVAKKPAVKKPAVKKPTAKKPAVRKSPAKPAASSTADPHAGHDMSQMPASPSTPESPAVDPHAGHDMSTMPAGSVPVPDPHTGHDMGAMDNSAPLGTDLPAGNAPPPPVPTANAADAIYGAPAMEMGRHHLNHFHGGQKLYQVMANIAEAQFGKGPTAFEWDVEGWYGGDINRLQVKSEGEGAFGGPIEKAEVHALYNHAIGPYFNVQGGVRYDFKPNPSRVYAAFGFEGLAPSFFDVEGTLFLSNKGELMARAEGYYDQRITQRLILQPRAELNFAAQSSREIGVGSGLSDAELGLRLRYDIRREFAPYVGVQYRRAFGATRRFLREEGEEAGGWSLLTGVRVWF
ncbi:MAG: copper resistance protein B [Pseudomonadota bacterium]|nr:copper resistance protein B [Pseudomonadota bacterium]